jgi:hypothetical protein
MITGSESAKPQSHENAVTFAAVHRAPFAPSQAHEYPLRPVDSHPSRDQATPSAATPEAALCVPLDVPEPRAREGGCEARQPLSGLTFTRQGSVPCNRRDSQICSVCRRLPRVKDQ